MYILLFFIIIISAILLAFISHTNTTKTGGGIKQVKKPTVIFASHDESDLSKSLPVTQNWMVADTGVVSNI